MVNGIKLTHIATGYPEEIALNYKEMQLALDKSDNINKSQDMLLDCIYERLGIYIEGNYELETLVLNGKERPLH